MKFVAILVSIIALGCTEHGKGGPLGSDGGNGTGRICGGFSGEQCGADEFCDFGRNGCGADDATGECRKRPAGCPDIFDPVCGCDNRTHGNECEAAASGVDVNAFGTCPIEPGNFACGFRQCSLASEYCQRAGSDIGGEPDGFACLPLPPCAGDPSCACLQAAGEPCADVCNGDSAIGLTITCLGG